MPVLNKLRCASGADDFDMHTLDYLGLNNGHPHPAACRDHLRAAQPGPGCGPPKTISFWTTSLVWWTFATDRNLADAINIVFNLILASGGGTTKIAVSIGLQAKARSIVGVEGWLYCAVADAMEVIPRRLMQNSGGNAIRVLTELRAKHANRESS